jgi:hypothetical protein
MVSPFGSVVGVDSGGCSVGELLIAVDVDEGDYGRLVSREGA